MMLDNKNEQKWPLTEKEVLKKEQTVKGHFFCFFGQADRVLRSSKKEGSRSLPQHIQYIKDHPGLSTEICA